MEAPKIIYLQQSKKSGLINGYYNIPIWKDTHNNIKYIRADLAEQPETNLLEESYMRGFAQGAKEERKDLTPIINRLCEAILFEWKDAADLARKTLIQIKARED